MGWIMSMHRDIGELFRDGTEIDRALARAVAAARREHKLLGFPMVDWRDGRVVVVLPEEIEIGDADLELRETTAPS